MLVVAPCLSGCVGYVAGDLRNTQSTYARSKNTDIRFDYEVRYKSEAKDDGGDLNFAGIVSSWTLGIVPTYWTSIERSKATIFENGAPIYTANYRSRVHKFYGILWAIILPSNTINSLQADEGGGLRVAWGIRDRTFHKVVAEHGGNLDQYHLVDEYSP